MTPPADTLQEDLSLLFPPGTTAAGRGHAAELWLAVGLVVAAIAVLMWWRRRRRAAKPAGGRVESAAVVALRELDRCAGARNGPARREAVVAASAILRGYLEARFGFRAPVLTSEEFRAEQGTRRWIPAEHEGFWSDFLAATDTIKYAGRDPGAVNFARLLDAARDFVRASGGEGGRA